MARSAPPTSSATPLSHHPDQRPAELKCISDATQTRAGQFVRLDDDGIAGDEGRPDLMGEQEVSVKCGPSPFASI